MLYIIRHAQASYLSDNYDQLSDLGIQQANALGEYLSSKIDINRIYVGPHKRHIQTSEQISVAYKNNGITIPSPVTIPHLKEYSGPATLQHYKPQLIKQDPNCIRWHKEAIANPDLIRSNSIKIFDHFIPQWMAGEYYLEGLEDFATFRKEIAVGVDKILESYEPVKNTLIVTSAGSTSAIMAHLLGINNIDKIAEYCLSVYNASITNLQIKKGKWQLENFNNSEYLSKNRLTVV